VADGVGVAVAAGVAAGAAVLVTFAVGFAGDPHAASSATISIDALPAILGGRANWDEMCLLLGSH
jgi:hypothetical protein